MTNETLPAFVIAAPRSAAGKTLVSSALLAHWRASGKRVSAAKLGPDYLDAQFLTSASATPCLNLDPWAMRPSTLQALLSIPFEQGAELLLIESAMGMFDGAADGYNTGSAYSFASMFSPPLPIVLLLSAKGCSGASLAAMARGFLQPSPMTKSNVGHGGLASSSPLTLPPCALLINDVASARHEDLLARALHEAFPETPLLGFLPYDSALFMPSRHLGLVQPEELPLLNDFFARAASWISQHVDCDKLIDFTRDMTFPKEVRESVIGSSIPSGLPPPAQRIAVAQDKAFRFFYHGQAELWRKLGAEVSFFSPLADETPPACAEWIYLPGGYPELHAAELSSKTRFFEGLRASLRSSSRVSIYGECGGYICLGEGLEDADGKMHKMAGLLPLSVSYKRQGELRRKPRLFYASAESSSPLFGSCRLRGHLFHTASIVREGEGEGGRDGGLFSLTDATGLARGMSGTREGNVCGSFFHAIDCQE